MHYLTTEQGFDLGRNGRFSHGTYICEDAICGAVLNAMLGIKLNAIPPDKFQPLDEKTDYNDKSILILRSGAMGDLVLLTPCIREIHRRWPKAIVGISCVTQFADLVGHMEGVHYVSFPVDSKIAEQYDVVIALENSVENNPAADKRHMTDMFAERLGLSSIEDKQPHLIVNEVLSNDMLVRYPRVPGVPRLAVQQKSSGNLRTYPDPFLSGVMRELHLKRGWDIYLLGEPGSNQYPSIERLTNCTQLGFSIRESLALLATCDMALAPDSFIVHAAAALDIPVLGLYAAFDGKTRAAYSPSVQIMQAKGDCAPCCFHDRPDRPGNPNGPCAITGRCEVLVTLTPAMIVSKLESMWKKISA